MRLFRVNLKRSMGSFIKSGKVNCPTSGHGGWTTATNIRSGDLILVAEGTKNITHVCYAKADPIISNVDYFKDTQELCEQRMTVLDLEVVYDYRESPIQAEELNSVLGSTTLNSTNFCVEPFILDDRISKVLNVLNKEVH